MNTPKKVLIGAYVRTPIGKVGGKLSRLEASDMVAHVLKSATRRAGIKDLSLIDLIVAGHAVQSYFEPNTARVSAQKAGLPDNITAYTIQHQCASGINAAHAVWSALRQGEAALGIACGVESMSLPPLIVSGKERYSGLNRWLTSRSPKFLRKMFKTYGPLPFFGLAESGLGPMKQSKDPAVLNMIKTAQIVGDLMGITRQEADEFAARSQHNALAAMASGRLAAEIEPIAIPGVGLVEHDEFPRQTSVETLAKLPARGWSLPAMQAVWVTALVLLCSSQKTWPSNLELCLWLSWWMSCLQGGMRSPWGLARLMQSTNCLAAMPLP